MCIDIIYMQKYNFTMIYVIFREAKCLKEKGGLFTLRSQRSLFGEACLGRS